MRRVIWTNQAADDLDSIRNYIGQFSPIAAQRIALRLVVASDSLADSAERGRALDDHRRELAAVRPYLIRYRVDAEDVYILEIRHGARSI